MESLAKGQQTLQPCPDGATASLRDDLLLAALGASDMIVRCLSYLDSHDLANVALTSRAYGGIAQQPPSPPADAVSPLPLVEKTARQICKQETTAEERAALPKHEDESWLELLHNLEIHRGRLVFQQLFGPVSGTNYVGGDKARLSASLGGHHDTSTAVCNEVMRAGRHFATVEIFGGRMHRFGVIRPIQHFDRWGLRSFNPYNASMRSDLLSGRTDWWGSGDIHCSSPRWRL